MTSAAESKRGPRQRVVGHLQFAGALREQRGMWQSKRDATQVRRLLPIAKRSVPVLCGGFTWNGALGWFGSWWIPGLARVFDAEGSACRSCVRVAANRLGRHVGDVKGHYIRLVTGKVGSSDSDLPQA